MTMHYLASVKSMQSDWGLICFTPDAHISIDYPCDETPDYVVLLHWPQPRGGTSRTFPCFADAMDFASRFLKQSETV